MKTKHSGGHWTAHKNTSWGENHKQNFGDKEGYVITHRSNGQTIVVASVIGVFGVNQSVIDANAKLIAHAPQLLQMVYDLKKCIDRLTQDDLSQFERDSEATWTSDAHELLSMINPDYYTNANTAQHENSI